MPPLPKDRQEALLQEVHVAVLSVARREGSPMSLPIWYEYRDGVFWIDTDMETLHGRLLRARGRATLLVQDEQPPYRYVSVEGPVEFHGDVRDIALRIAERYIGPELAQQHVDVARPRYQPHAEAVSLRPERTWAAWFGEA